MQIVSSSHRYLFFFLLLLTSLTSLTKLSEVELYHLENNEPQDYLYCGKDRSVLPEFIEAVAQIDDNIQSPVWRLHDHIIKGFVIGRMDTILEALEYAEKTLDHKYRQLSHEQLEEMYANLYMVMHEIRDGVLDIDINSLSEEQRRDCCSDNAPSGSKIKVREKLYVLDKAKFFKDVEFKKDVEIEGDLKVEGNAEIEGTLSVADEIVGCDLTVGCNIIMNDSTSAAVGNIVKGGVQFMSNFGVQNTFLGSDSGNFSMTGGSNTGIGFHALTFNALGAGNTAVGSTALEANVAGGGNTAVGSNALQNNIAAFNTAVGAGSLQFNTTGTQNVAVGISSLNSNITGSSNTAVGYSALVLNTNSNNTAVGALALNQNGVGAQNTAMGATALQQNTVGSFNTAIGDVALQNNTVGSFNSALGGSALTANIVGLGNTALGFGALSANINGNFNIAIGTAAGNLHATGDNNIYIANTGLAAEAGTIRIGTLGTQSSAFMQGIFGAVVGIGGLPVEVDSTGKLGTIVSSMEFKKDIRDMEIASENINKLRPVKFAYRNDKTNAPQYGLIAEEVAEIFPELVVYNVEGKPYSVRYQVLPVMLLHELQKQHASIEALAERVAHLEAAA